MSEDKEWTEKNYADLSNARVDAGFDRLDEVMAIIINEGHLNYFEVQTILAMMHKKVERNNIDQYLIEACDRFCKKQNKEDLEGR
jgi:hypothetical protein